MSKQSSQFTDEKPSVGTECILKKITYVTNDPLPLQMQMYMYVLCVQLWAHLSTYPPQSEFHTGFSVEGGNVL